VTDYGAARDAVAAGATVVQLRLKGVPTSEVIERGAGFSALPAMFVVNDDVEAAVALAAAAVHLGDDDPGWERAVAAGLLVGVSASTPHAARVAERRGAAYVGCGPVWSTPSKPDAGAAIGIDGLRSVCGAVSLPVIAIGGIESRNAAACITAGAAGVAVLRASREAGDVRAEVDRALAQMAASSGSRR